MNKMSHDLAEPVGRHDHQVKICGVGIPLVSRWALLPLSYSQQRLWFLDQLVPGGSNYNVPGAVKFEGPLDVEVLERALREIVRRHEALRTRFVAVEGEAEEMFLDEVKLKLEVMEVGGEEKEREEKTERLAREEAQRPFDLGEAPLLRTRLLRRGAEDHVLLVTMHHIISDAWSLGVLIREASVLYRAFSAGKESPLPELEIQYVDYCAWQREWLSADVLERQVEYWKKRLSGAAPGLEMPTDHPRPAMQSSRGARKKVSLGEELVEELRRMGAEEGATLYMVLLAGFQALLYRYSGQADIAVGSPITRRTRAETEGLIGLFVNTLVMRTEVEGGWSFKEMLERVKEGSLEAYGYQDVPFEMLVEVLVPQRDMSRTPLFQVMFILQNAPLPELELGSAKLKPFTVDYGTSKFDLTMSLEEVEEGIGGYVEYNTDLYEEGTVERLLGHYEMLLRGAVGRREERIEDLPLLRKEEREELERWNETEAQVEEKCIHELFEEQVERRPEAWAVAQGEKGLSYLELNEQANQLAWHLKSTGVGIESRVGVYLERSFEYVIALLGILKSGAAYVPLDPNYPDERLRFIVEIAKISTIVCKGPRPRLSIPDVNWIDIEGQDLLAERKDNLRAMASPENAAYIIFTSGSTGIPNGVIGLHRGAVNRFSWMWRQYPFIGNEKSALKTSINFGDSIWEVFGPLLRGVPSVLLDDDTVRSPRALIAALDAERITRMVVVPSLLRLLLEADPVITDHLPALRYWTSSGEVLPPDLLNRFRQLLPQHRILNLYGCSEVSADSLAIEVTHGDFVTNVPIGRPISNTQAYLLDEAMQPVPIGVTGEIYLSGNGLARGYLFQPDLTAERFLPHPYSSEPGARIYRTRDLARYRPNGAIEYVGRADRQVKLRGMRIDLREVEAVLRQSPLVKEAVVLLKSIPPVGESVVAYVTSQESLTSRKLRTFLKQRLPGYMVPSVYVTLEAMPLNANGKIDRHALPEPKLERSEGYIRPRTPVEELVSQTWSEVLGVEQVGAEDDFFALGGHSLLATQVIARLRATLGVELPLRALFERPTVEALAGQVQLARGRQRGVEPPLRQRARQGELPLSYAQERLWFVAQLEGGSEAYHVPLGLRLEGNLNQVALQRALDRIVWRHEALRTSFQRVEERRVQKIAPADSGFVLTEDDLRGCAETALELDRRLVEEAQAPFDLEHGPLIRGRLIRVGEQEQVLAITMHHIVSDGWSLDVLREEMSALYQAYGAGEEDPLPPLPIQYADYAVWQREWLSGERLQRQREYWRQVLEGAPGLLELPTDRARPEQQCFVGNAVRVELDRELVQSLKAQGRKHGATLYMTMLAAWAVVLSRLSGQEEVVIGTPVANRIREEIEKLIGFFVNTQALRVEACGSVAELLEQVKASALGAQEHQDMPFEQVVELLKVPRSLSHTPIFQVILAWQNNAEGVLDLPGVAVSPANMAYTPVKFDLELDLSETGDGVSGVLRYATALFDRSTIERHAGYLRRVLEAMVGDEQRAVDRIDLLSEAERHELLIEWNDTRREYPHDKCIHELFEAQVERTPNAIAVVFEELRISYAELNQRANRLAHYLVAREVEPETFVAISMERRVDMVVAMLATLKAGGAYVPLDSYFPQDRQDFIVADCNAKVVIADQDRSKNFPGMELSCVDVQRAAPAIERCSSSNPGIRVDAENSAYVLYTSGSTGIPKGTIVTHRAVNRLVINNNYASIEAADCVAHCSSPAFDASTFEVWGALLNGARMLLVSRSVVLDPKLFSLALKQNGVTTLWLTSALLNQYADSLGSIFPQLKYLLAGGERLDPRVIRRVLHDNPPQNLLNGYGPTECTTFSCTYRIQSVAEEASNVPIGCPIANAQTYILDRHLQPIPIGVTGEIYIGGAGLARGYLQRPDLTAERFIPSPFAPGERLYKTGDLGRWCADGLIECLGRNDFQVKIRGFRIELGEIEARLGQHPQVLQAVVLAREDTPGDKLLVAYLQLRPGESLKVEDLRRYLAEVLPEYMVPAVYLTLEKFPLTANGKLDRKRLPEPDADAYVKRAYEEPVGEVESRIAQIWAEVLKLDRVGRYDNFFELGGHSLLAIKAIGRARRAGLQIEVRSLFAAPTLKALAEVVGKEAFALEVPPNLIPPGCTCITPGMLPLVQLSENEIAAIVSSVQGGAANVEDIYPLAPLQAGMLFHHRLQTEGDVALIERVFGFDTRERFDRYAAALQAVIDRHDVLRTAFVWEDLPEPVQVVWRHAALAIEEVELDAARDDVAAQLRTYCNPRHRRLDLRQAPLWRLFIAEDAANKRWVAVELIHHLIQDETTFRLLGADLEAFLLGQAQHLPAPIPFRNFVAQARLAVSQSEHEAFFSEMLDGVDEPTMAFSLGDIQGDGSRIAAAEQHLDYVLSGRLRAAARTTGVSVATLCHLAWAMVLARTSGRDDVTFGTIIFGRMQASDGADRALGMFINLLPLRLQVGNESVYASLRKTHRLLSQLLRHEHAPLSLAQRCSGIRSPRPLFTATLNYHHGVAEARSAEALRQSARAWEGIELFDTQQRTNYPFNMYIEDLVDDITLIALVDKSLDPVRVCGLMRGALESLADGLEYARESPPCRLDILSVAERQQVTIDFNATATTHSQDVCLHTLFEAQVARTPNAIALVDEGGLITYDELNRRANQLARHLRTIGIVPDARVAICLERGPDMVVSMLATLKAGAGYVPLDPAYPVDRLAYMIEDSAPSVILTRAAAAIGYTGAIPVLDVQADGAAWSGEAETDPGLEDVLPQHTAYVIYTSGSTGQPKGVVVEHANVVNLVHEYIEMCSLTASDRILQFASYSFDASVEEIFPALCVGATIVLRPAHLTIPDVSFVNFLVGHQVTIADLPTAFWHLWAGEVEEGRSKPDVPLRMVIVGGEKAERRHLINWFERCGNRSIRWINTYGPTEATVNATSLCVDPAAVAELGEIPIGRPVANARIYILDSHRQVTPVGVAGEIHVGGAGVVRGYLGKPGLTSERFIPDPFFSKPGGRLYKTGDVGRWLPDGNVEYLGRNDFQVKIRGYRIELGEIESKVGHCPGVRSAVVIVREDTPGEKRLVAYVSPEPGAELSAATLRAHLAASLPAYMLPGAFVQLDALPLTPSGKLDREALPMPEDDAFATRAYEEPLNEVEIAIAQIWADVLDLDRVGRHDNFFELGGHSLLVTAVIERMRSANLKAEVRALFLAPTPALLAGLTEEVTEVVL